MTVSVTLDMMAATPPYEQVRAQLAGHIRAGALRPGDKLPVVRALAADLGVATNTVARAYKELEALGVVETRGRAGTFVAGHGVTRSLREAAASYAATARSLGVSEAEALEAVRRALG